jgi:hypothetical protein
MEVFLRAMKEVDVFFCRSPRAFLCIYFDSYFIF